MFKLAVFIYLVGLLPVSLFAESSINPLDNKLALVGVIADSSKQKDSGIAVMQLISAKKKIFVKKGTKIKVSGQNFEIVKIQGKEVHLQSHSGKNFVVTLNGFSAYVDSSKGSRYNVREEIFSSFEGSTYEDGAIPPPPPPPSDIEWYEDSSDNSGSGVEINFPPGYKKNLRKPNSPRGGKGVRDFSDLNNLNSVEAIEEVEVAPNTDFEWDL